MPFHAQDGLDSEVEGIGLIALLIIILLATAIATIVFALVIY